MIDSDCLDVDWDEDPEEALDRIWKQEDQHYERYQKQRKQQKGKRWEPPCAWEKQQYQRLEDDYTD